MPRDAPLAPPPHAPCCPQLPRGKGGAIRTGEGIFLLFLTPTAPDYHVLHSEPRKHHSAMLQLGCLPSPARGRRRGAAGQGCEHVHTWDTGHGFIPPCPPRHTACSPPSGAERSPAACKHVCFSSPAPNSIRTNCILELGGVLGLGFSWLSP